MMCDVNLYIGYNSYLGNSLYFRHNLYKYLYRIDSWQSLAIDFNYLLNGTIGKVLYNYEIHLYML